jgi:hypothetical protein
MNIYPQFSIILFLMAICPLISYHININFLDYFEYNATVSCLTDWENQVLLPTNLVKNLWVEILIRSSCECREKQIIFSSKARNSQITWQSHTSKLNWAYFYTEKLKQAAKKKELSSYANFLWINRWNLAMQINRRSHWLKND